MDSSNSGSYQSSSGGAADTEEYNSRTQQSSISSFLNNNNNNSNNFNNLSNTFFNPNTTLNPVQDLSSLWTGTLQQQLQQPVQHVQDRFTSFQHLPNSLPMDTNPKPGQTGREPGGHGHGHHMGVIKNPKKRTRASRRAPTTVLTTDTTNFRQMVQEFTGIPTGPFTGGGGVGATLSRRLDLFRPSATKFQPVQVQPSYLNSLNNNDNIHPSSIDQFTKQPSSLVDMQSNPMLSFQSLLQTTMNHNNSNNNNQDSSNDLGAFASTSRKWSGENEKMENFEGVIGNNQNIGGSKINSGDQVQVQVQGNDQGSWICHSN